MDPLESVKGRALTEVQVAEQLGVSVRTVRDWRVRRNGQLARFGPAYLKVGRAVRYRPEDVEAYIRVIRIGPLT